MKRIFPTLLVSLSTCALVACATAGGAAVGAGIGSVSGNTRAGALIGGGMGLLYDYL